MRAYRGFHHPAHLAIRSVGCFYENDSGQGPSFGGGAAAATRRHTVGVVGASVIRRLFTALTMGWPTYTAREKTV